MKTACQCGLLKFLGKLTVGGDGKGIEVKYQPNCACNIVCECVRFCCCCRKYKMSTLSAHI